MLKNKIFLRNFPMDLINIMVNFLDIPDVYNFRGISKEYYRVNINWRELYSNVNKRDFIFEGNPEKYCYYSALPLNECKLLFRQKDNFRLDIHNFSLYDYPYLFLFHRDEAMIINLITMNKHINYKYQLFNDINVITPLNI